MHHLTQARTLKLAGRAALATALACCPRLLFWSGRAAPVWYLASVIFFCSIVLWGFVFAWHAAYTGRPVFTFHLDPRRFVTVTLAGLGLAVALHLFLDPALRLKLPEEYPADPKQWAALVLFTLAFNQLFLIFAPFAWLVRLIKNQWAAVMLTVLFSTAVVALKIRSAPDPLTPSWFAALLSTRIVMGFLAVWFYLRGGLLLSWWWTFLIEARHLFDLAGPPGP